MQHYVNMKKTKYMHLFKYHNQQIKYFSLDFFGLKLESK